LVDNHGRRGIRGMIGRKITARNERKPERRNDVFVDPALFNHNHLPTNLYGRDDDATVLPGNVLDIRSSQKFVSEEVRQRIAGLAYRNIQPYKALAVISQ